MRSSIGITRKLLLWEYSDITFTIIRVFFVVFSPLIHLTISIIACQQPHLYPNNSVNSFAMTKTFLLRLLPQFSWAKCHHYVQHSDEMWEEIACKNLHPPIKINEINNESPFQISMELAPNPTYPIVLLWLIVVLEAIIWQNHSRLNPHISVPAQFSSSPFHPFLSVISSMLIVV